MIKSLKERMKNKKGFTLVELIVVIVIILVLAAVMVPNLLKYIDRANKANCKADAATILSQVQADYAAMQASDQTGVTAITQIQGVAISEKTEGDVSATDVAVGTDKKPVAKYHVTTTSNGTGDADTFSYGEITSFGYNNAKYTAVWNQTGGWVITKN